MFIALEDTGCYLLLQWQHIQSKTIELFITKSAIYMTYVKYNPVGYTQNNVLTYYVKHIMLKTDFPLGFPCSIV